jgi:hypothetical protein
LVSDDLKYVDTRYKIDLLPSIKTWNGGWVRVCVCISVGVCMCVLEVNEREREMCMSFCKNVGTHTSARLSYVVCNVFFLYVISVFIFLPSVF